MKCLEARPHEQGGNARLRMGPSDTAMDGQEGDL